MRGAPIPCLPRRRVGWARRFRGARSPYGALLQGLRSGPGRWLHARARVEGGGRRAPVRARGPPRGGCWRFWRPALMVRGARAWPRGAARRVCAGIAKLVRTLGVSSTCACSSPCLLRVPMRCVLELCILVLGVWCTCAAFAQIVRHPLVNVVDIAGVRRPVLCACAVQACVVRASASHARILSSPRDSRRGECLYFESWCGLLRYIAHDGPGRAGRAHCLCKCAGGGGG